MLFPKRTSPLSPQELEHRNLKPNKQQHNHLLNLFGVKPQNNHQPQILIKRPWYKPWGDPDPSGELEFNEQYEHCVKLLEECKDKGMTEKSDWRENNIAWKSELSSLLSKSLKVVKYKINLVKQEDRELHG